MDHDGAFWPAFCAGAIAMLAVAVLILLWLMTPRGRGFATGGPFKLDGRVVVVTGAASGIGLELCRAIAERFSAVQIHMWDIDEAALKAAVRELGRTSSSSSCSIHATVCDVTEPQSVERAAAATQALANGRHVSLLVNNAGILAGKTWDNLSVTEFERTVALGTVAHFSTIKAFLPAMRAANDGTVVSVSSLMGLLPGVQLLDYCTAKHGAVGLHEALSLELSCSPGNRVHAMLVCPYVVDTGMFEGAFEARELALTRWLFPFLKTRTVVDRILRGLDRREHVVVIPGILTLAPYVIKVLPIRWWQFCLKLFGASRGMSTFRGRGAQKLA